jgi:hypothetical protein
MPHRTITTLLAVLATTAGAATFAHGASASVVSAVVDNDPLGDLLQHHEVTFTDGNVAFRWGNGAVSGRVTGTLHIVEGDDACFRLRTDALDSSDNLVGSTYSRENGHCPHSDDPVDVPIDLQTTGGSDVRRVRVALEKEHDKGWKTKETSATVSVGTSSDDVTLLASGIDVGGASWLTGAPTGPATVSWTIEDDGRLTATYDGFLHLKNPIGGAGRVEIRAINPVTGFQVDSAQGPQHTPADNAHHAYGDTLSVTSSSGSQVEVAMQTLAPGGAWQDAGTQTVSAAE